ncbi:MAG: DUF3078 domain-containing protein [Bacteroidales bacterium]|jgi:hypothetical protein|nr:DUF3078 domain-containing protein [Bacteroidales bacterium]
MCFFFFITTLSAQEKDSLSINKLSRSQELCRSIGARFGVPVINYQPVVPEKFWKKGILTNIGFSQISLTNWAAGGSGSVAMNANVNVSANYEKGKTFWENKVQLAYGFIKSFQNGYRKSDDRIVLQSKFGYKAVNKLYFSASFNFNSQFSPGFKYDSKNNATMVSQFLSPGYITLGLGMTYKPGKGKIFSLNISPLTGSMVIVTDPDFRSKYGNDYDENVRYELGAQVVGTLKCSPLKDFKLSTSLNFFSDYWNNPQNLKVNWDFESDYKLNKFLSAKIATNLIYDDNVWISDGNGNSSREVQLKEIFSLAFTYTFGTYTK